MLYLVTTHMMVYSLSKIYPKTYPDPYKSTSCMFRGFVPKSTSCRFCGGVWGCVCVRRGAISSVAEQVFRWVCTCACVCVCVCDINQSSQFGRDSGGMSSRIAAASSCRLYTACPGGSWDMESAKAYDSAQRSDLSVY